MKNCPYCGSAIEENARVCLYCMKELEPKAQMNKAFFGLRRWIWPISAALLVVAVGVTAFFLWPEKAPAPESAQGGQTVTDKEKLPLSQQSEAETSNSEGELEESQRPASGAADGSKEENSAPSSGKQESGGKKEAAEQQAGKKEQESSKGQENNKQQEVSGDQESNKDQESAKDQEENKEQENNSNQENDREQEGIGDQESEEEQEPSLKPEESEPAPPAAATYLYRDAKYGVDDYHVTANVDHCVVITGVATPAADGIYRLPETLGGKKVIAISGLAFSDAAIRDGVKAVYIPAGIRSVWGAAFSGCVNLTNVYFYGTSIYVDFQAFPPKEQRSGTLTIHCAYDCNNRDFRYYRNIAQSYYDAVYKEWNG